MIPFVIFILAISSGNTHNISSFPKIVGGIEANIRDYPFIVAILQDANFICGGSIIKPDYVVTAAHCYNSTFPFEYYEVIAGTADLLDGGVRRQVTNIIKHPNYDQKKLNYDVAVMKLNAPLEYIPGQIQSIKLPEPSDCLPPIWGTVIGWGSTYNNEETLNKLRAVQLKIFRTEFCKITLYIWYLLWNAGYHSADTAYDVSHITEVKFCAGSNRRKGACHGDSGGPLVIDNILYGTVSYGDEVCAGFMPEVFTKIPVVVDWIKETANFTS